MRTGEAEDSIRACGHVVDFLFVAGRAQWNTQFTVHPIGPASTKENTILMIFGARQTATEARRRDFGLWLIGGNPLGADHPQG